MVLWHNGSDIMAKKRPDRVTLQVQLEIDDTAQRFILDIAGFAKARKRFKDWVMRGLQIVWGLEHGDMKPLMRWYGGELSAHVKLQTDAQFQSVFDYLQRLEKQIDAMNTDRISVGMKPVETPIKPPALVMKVGKDKNTSPAKNFMKMFQSINHD